MKKYYLFFAAALVLLTSCSKEKDLYDTEKVMETEVENNLKSVFGTVFSENTDWTMIKTGQVTITADAKLDNIEKVQVLTGYPFGPDPVYVLNETKAAKGSTVTLSYDAPDGLTRLYAACVSPEGYYRVKAFDLGTTSVKFGSSATRAVKPATDATAEGITVEAIDDFTETELEEFESMILNFIPKGHDNTLRFTQSEIYINDANYMTTAGDDPIVVTPMHMSASYYNITRLYYYYYNPADYEAADDKDAFLQNLPAYQIMYCKDHYDNGFYTKKVKRYTLPTITKGYKVGFFIGVDGIGDFYTDSRLNANSMNRTAVFGANGSNFIGFEDGIAGGDRDFDDLVIEVKGGVQDIDEKYTPDPNVYTFAYEDRRVGDYDMNDVIVKAKRIDATHVEFSLEATGANDELYLRSQNYIDLTKAQKLNANTEVHAILGTTDEEGFVNTKKQVADAVHEVFTVPEDYSFYSHDLYVHNKTKGWDVHIVQHGSNPCAILIPYDWKYPIEKNCVKNAYPQFNNWATNGGSVVSTQWYTNPVEDLIYNNSFVQTAE